MPLIGHRVEGAYRLTPTGTLGRTHNPSVAPPDTPPGPDSAKGWSAFSDIHITKEVIIAKGDIVGVVACWPGGRFLKASWPDPMGSVQPVN